MQTFELDIFIDCPQYKIFDHISQPINMIGLQPLLTEIDILEEKMENNVIQRPFQTVETFRWLGLPIFKNRNLFIINLTKPKEELEFHVYSRSNIEIIFKYSLRESNDKRTQITQTVQFVKVNKLLEKFVVRQANQAQRALLSNLKVRLEKK
ncbi:MAG TPA: hypothetical protein DCX53_04165 [Anaerolineae bacterium]|nr:hypothetical protein [Anaerolineae bacterium]